MAITEKPTDIYTPRARTALTPVLKIGGSTTGITYTSRSGSKVVDQNGVCTWWMKLVLSSKGAQTGAVTIEGLTDNAATGGVGNVQIGARAKIAATKQLTAKMAGGASAIVLFDALDDGTASTPTADTDLQNDSSIELSGSYLIDV